MVKIQPTLYLLHHGSTKTTQRSTLTQTHSDSKLDLDSVPTDGVTSADGVHANVREAVVRQRGCCMSPSEAQGPSL